MLEVPRELCATAEALSFKLTRLALRAGARAGREPRRAAKELALDRECAVARRPGNSSG